MLSTIPALTSGASTRAAPLRSNVIWASTDVQVSDPASQFAGDQKSLYEPSLAIDPTDPETMLSFAIDLSFQNEKPEEYSTIRAYRSTNAGRTWLDQGPVRYSKSGEAWDSGDPVVAFAQDGTAYFASLAKSPSGKRGIYIQRSESAGKSWSLPVLAIPNTEDLENDQCTTTDKEWLSVDPASEKLFLAFTGVRYQCSTLNDPLGADQFVRIHEVGVYLSTSTDSGRNWSEPNLVWPGYALGAMPRTSPDGTLYMAFWTATEAPPTACPTPAGTLLLLGGGRPFAAIARGRSVDGGKTWTFNLHTLCDFIAGEVLKSGRFVGGRSLPTVAVDQSTGIAHIAWPELDPLQGRFVVKYAHSDDGPTGWSEPVEVTLGPEDAQIPALAAVGGVVRLVYVTSSGIKDHQSETIDGEANTYYVESRDDGESWSDPLLLSSRAGGLGENTEVGDYNTIDIAGNRVAVVWTDARDPAQGQIWSRSGLLTKSSSREQSRTLTMSSPVLPSVEFGLTPRSGPLTHRAFFQRPDPCPRKPLTRLISHGSGELHARCSISDAFFGSRRIARRAGLGEVMVDNEGFEAELLLSDGKDLVLVKITSGRAGRALVTVLPLD